MSDDQQVSWRDRLAEFEREEREKLEAKARGRYAWCRAVERLLRDERDLLASQTIDDVEVLQYLLHLHLAGYTSGFSRSSYDADLAAILEGEEAER